MTYDEFLDHFRTIAHCFGNYGSLRGMGHNYVDHPYAWCCPITAVCLKIEHQHFSVGEYYKAAELLGLNIYVAKRIVCAADNTDTDTSIRQDLVKIIDEARDLYYGSDGSKLLN